MMRETKAPSAEELAAVKLKNAQTKEGRAFEEAPYKAVWESSGEGRRNNRSEGCSCVVPWGGRGEMTTHRFFIF